MIIARILLKFHHYKQKSPSAESAESDYAVKTSLLFPALISRKSKSDAVYKPYQHTAYEVEQPHSHTELHCKHHHHKHHDEREQELDAEPLLYECVIHLL